MSIIFQGFLLCWYFFAIYLVAVDPTLSTYLKIVMEMVGLLCIFFISMNLFWSGNKSIYYNIAYYSTGIILLMWYLYYTPLDIMNQGYSLKEKIIYGFIDIVTIIYLVLSMLTLHFNTILHKLDITSNALRAGGAKCLAYLCTMC